MDLPVGYVLTFALDIAPAYALLIMNTSAQKFEFFFFLFVYKENTVMCRLLLLLWLGKNRK